jgi:pimeloyl-ACP methyl ester carboxylesterase
MYAPAVHKVKVPVLLVGGAKDEITPVHHIKKAASLMDK